MSKKSHSKKITAFNNGLKNALLRRVQDAVNGKPFRDDELLPNSPLKLASQAGDDPIIADYIAFRREHPTGPLPKSLTDRMAAAMPGIDLERVGKNFVRDMLSGQPEEGTE